MSEFSYMNDALISIRIENVEDRPKKNNFFRVILTQNGKPIQILESSKCPELVKYKSIIES